MLAEKAVLSRILFNNEWNSVMDRRVTEELFQDMECRKCFKYVYDFYSKYGKVPSIDLVEEEFKDLRIEYAKEPVDYYLDKMSENYVRVKGSQVLIGSAREIVQSPMKGIEKLQTAVAELVLEAVPTRDDLVEDTVEERMARYLRLKKVGGMDGMPTPWEVLNEATMGLHGGDFIAIVSRPGVGKGHPNWLSIPTPNGDKKIGDLKVGDYVFDRYGKPTRVTGVYPRGLLETYEVTLNDGRSTVVDGDHIWSYFTKTSKGEDKLLNKTTREMYEEGTHLKKRKPNGKFGLHAKYSIPVNEPVEFRKQELSISPYVIGALIGDGYLKASALTISSNDVYVVEKVAALLGTEAVKSNPSNYHWCFKAEERDTKRKYLQTKDILKKVPEILTYSHEKQIPERYMYSSIEDRMELLNGLFDTDGYATINGKRLYVGYTTTSKELARQVRWLLQSCGYLSGEVLDRREGRRDCYNISVLGQADKLADLFTLPVKRDIVESFARIKNRCYDRIAIKSIVKREGLEDVTCISVENEEQLYLCNDFIVTHNTFMLTLFAEYATRNKQKVLFVTNEMSNTQIMQRFDAVYFKLPYKELRAGLLPDALEKMYFEGLEKMKKDVKMVVTQDVHGVNSVGSKIDQYKPDLVLIDGMYLLADDQNSQSRWEGISNISRNLKKLARKKNVPIIATTQFNRASEGVKIDRVTLSNLGFSDSIGQDADVVLGLFRTKDMEMNNEMKVRMLKVREGEPKDFTLQWDLRYMRFDAIETSDDNSFLPEEIDEGTISY